MKKEFLTAVTFVIVFCGYILAQSEYARQVAESYRESPIYRHYVTSGDMLVNQPDHVVFIPKQEPMVLGDRYNDHFQVIAHDGKLFAFWTQASRESDIDQHIAFSKSADGGKTWSAIQVLAGSPNKRNPQLRASWQQPIISKSGRIYVLWNQQTTSRGPHWGKCFGIFSDDQGETWSAPKEVQIRKTLQDAAPEDPPFWCNWQRPLRLGEDGKYLVGSSRFGRSEFWQFENIDEDPAVEDIQISFFMAGEKALAVPEAEVGPYDPTCEEPSIVKLPDGRLFAIMRTHVGYIYWSQSRDQGKTWDTPKKLLNRDGGKPFLHPCSPCPMYDWKGCEAGSGLYFALVHNYFDFNKVGDFNQDRRELYLIAGKFVEGAEQPIWFTEPKMFFPRKRWNSIYSSYTYENGEGILWFNDVKVFLYGRNIGDEWFKGVEELK
ncbi:MAG: sialidase family protein [Planctomycetia bacterium]|nr:sialidase family protein [Planctomycetia bacterium]